LGAVSNKDILSIKLSHLTYMFLDTCFDITLGFTNIKAFVKKIVPVNMALMYIDVINLEEPIGYPAHTRLISLSICPSVHQSVRLSICLSRIQKHVDFECKN
jgi:hypothetical protein